MEVTSMRSSSADSPPVKVAARTPTNAMKTMKAIKDTPEKAMEDFTFQAIVFRVVSK